MSAQPRSRTLQNELHNGDHLTQAEFHRLYEMCPDHVKAELIGGVVYMASPLRRPHGRHHVALAGAMFFYEAHTLGTEALDNTTTILSEESEPQPDLALRILPEYGGQSGDTDDHYISGCPELVAEIAHSSTAFDLHEKKADYQKYGVLEYVVLCVTEEMIVWHHFPSGKEIRPTREGVYRSRVFPGLWLSGPALMKRDSLRVFATLQQGLQRREHAAFVQRLAKQRREI